MNIVIVGVGLIGGSLALGLKGFQTKLIGVDVNEAHTQESLKLGLVDEVLPLDDAVGLADLIVLAVPVDAARDLLPYILDRISDKAVVTDMGSTKAGVCKNVQNHAKRKNFVASHPIAGTENSGPQAAFSTLFEGKTTIICEREKSHDFAVKLIEKMYQILNMKVLYMGSEEHDRHIAYVSHLSHVISFTLGLTVLEIEKDEDKIFNMAGSGFASTARLAKSSPNMWVPIFDENAENLINAVESFSRRLEIIKDLIENRKTDELQRMMVDANDIRRILDGMKSEGGL